MSASGIALAPTSGQARRGGARFQPQVGLLVDAVMLAVAGGIDLVAARAAGVPAVPIGWAVVFPVVVLVLLARRGLYRARLQPQLLDDLRTILGVTAVATMAVISVRVLVSLSADVAVQAVREWVFATVYLAAGRTGLVHSQLRARRRGEGLRSTLIVGAGAVGRLTASRLREHPEFGLRPVGFLDKEPLYGSSESELPVLGASWDFPDIIRRHGIEHVVITFSTAPHHVLLRIVRECEAHGIPVASVPRLFEKIPCEIRIEHLGALPFVSTYPSDPRGWQFRVKYAFDRVIAALALALALPVLAIITAAVWRSVGRPILFRQVRVGRDGRSFEMLKFRSMKAAEPNAARTERFELPSGSAPGGVEGADRRTRVGAFLRRTSLDELPQLINVARGEMSLVGPRPERPEFVELFERDVYRYTDRHRVKSGITGWAQVHGLRGKTSLADRVEWDNYYIENWSLWLDVKILLLTVLAAVRPGRVE